MKYKLAFVRADVPEAKYIGILFGSIAEVENYVSDLEKNDKYPESFETHVFDEKNNCYYWDYFNWYSYKTNKVVHLQ